MKTVPCITASESGFVNAMPQYEIPDQLVDTIIQYESGELEDFEVVQLFQALIDTKLAWQIRGSYERLAKQLVDAGVCFSNAA